MGILTDVSLLREFVRVIEEEVKEEIQQEEKEGKEEKEQKEQGNPRSQTIT